MRLFARALVAAVALTAVSTGAAYADTAPPVTGDDAVSMVAGSESEPDVLANDTDPNGEPLAVCRLGNVDSGIDAELVSGRLMIFAAFPGVYKLTYYACDYQYLTPATVTVTVKAAPVVQVRVQKSDRHPGMLRVANRDHFRITFAWGSYRSGHADGHVGIAPRSVAWVHVRRVSLIWIAYNARLRAERVGIVRGIRLPKGVHALPPGAPPVGASVPRARWASAPWVSAR